MMFTCDFSMCLHAIFTYFCRNVCFKVAKEKVYKELNLKKVDIGSLV